MSTQQFNTLQQNIKTTLTRRAVLGQLAGLAALATVPLFAPDLPPITEYVCDLPLPYGPPARTAIIDLWLTRIDGVIAGMTDYRRFLAEARALPPTDVDGVKLLWVESEAHRLSDDLIGHIECDTLNDLISAVTGRPAPAVSIEGELLNPDPDHFKRPDHINRAFWQREIDQCSQDHPEERARLQAALEARFGGAR